MTTPPDPNDIDRLSEVFLAAADLPREARSSYLDEACGTDTRLRAEVEALLREDAAPATLFEDLDPERRRPPPPGMPEQIADYKVLGVLGRGGMGFVYRAEQRNPKRTVALKVLQPGVVGAENLGRFAKEAQVLGLLKHPGIAQIFDAGTCDFGFGEMPYFAMELIEGEPLTHFAKTHDLSIKAKCSLLARVCDAVQHAHERGVIHRDLKPANVIVTDPGTGTVEPQPKVLDFGIARTVDSEATLQTLQTSTGQLLGTLSHMSPEQLDSDAGDVDARSDVYALGVMLYETLADRLPLDLTGRPVTEVARMVMYEEPTQLRHHDRTLRGDLEAIAGTALAKEPARRYASAAAFAADLRRFVLEEPIAARPHTAWYQLRMFTRRNKALVGGVLATLLALTTGLILVSLFAADTERAREELRVSLYEAEMNLASAALDSPGGIGRVRDIVEAWRPAAGEKDVRGLEWDLLWAASHAEERVVPLPDVGMHVLWTGNRIVVTAAEHAIAYDPDTGAETDRIDQGGGHEGSLASVSHDGTVVATLSADDTVKLRTRTDFAVRQTLHDVPIDSSLALNHDGTLIAGHCRDFRLRVWDVATQRVVATFGERIADRALVFSPDGAHLAFINSDGGVCVANTRTWEIETDLPRPRSQPAGLDWTANGERLAMGNFDNRVLVWDVPPKLLLHTLEGHQNWVSDVAWSPDGELLASASWDYTIRLWDVGTATSFALRGHREPVLSIAWSDDGARLASVGLDQSLRIWRVPTRPAVRAFSTLNSNDCRLTWLPGGTEIAASDFVEGSRVVNIETGGLESFGRKHWLTASPQDGAGAHLDANGDTTTVVVAPDDGPQRSASLPIDGRSAWLAWEPNGSRLLIGTYQGRGGIWVWDPRSEAAPRRVSDLRCNTAVWRPDGAAVACVEQTRFVGRIGRALILDTHDFQTEASLSTPARLTDASWDPTGRRVALSSADQVVRVWEPGSKHPPHLLRGHTAIVKAVAWSPDGSRILSGGKDGCVKLWDPVRGTETLSLAHPTSVQAVAWRPDGSKFASLAEDGHVRLWDLPAGGEYSREETLATRRSQVQPNDPNDVPDGAIPLPPAGRIAFSMNRATLDRPESSLFNCRRFEPNVWFRWKASADGLVQATVQPVDSATVVVYDDCARHPIGLSHPPQYPRRLSLGAVFFAQEGHEYLVSVHAAPGTEGELAVSPLAFDDLLIMQTAKRGDTTYVRLAPLNWPTARAIALSMGGDLVSVNDAAEADFIRAELGSYGVWTGGNDAESEGTFTWSDGTPFAFQRWRSGEPNDEQPGEDYLSLMPSGDWNDTWGCRPQASIVEIRAKPQATENR